MHGRRSCDFTVHYIPIFASICILVALKLFRYASSVFGQMVPAYLGVAELLLGKSHISLFRYASELLFCILNTNASPCRHTVTTWIYSKVSKIPPYNAVANESLTTVTLPNMVNILRSPHCTLAVMTATQLRPHGPSCVLRPPRLQPGKTRRQPDFLRQAETSRNDKTSRLRRRLTAKHFRTQYHRQ
jgi:hypothetical protein